ncbi:MAG: uroporphyrinogen decarboxylase family protein [Pseudomonadota bacterium]
METGRERFKKFLDGEPAQRPAFVPLIRGLVARTEGILRQSITSDPTLWANSLMKAAALFDFDAVVAGYDFSLLAEACGCRISWEDDRPVVCGLPEAFNECPEACGSLQHALEATKRVFDSCRKERGCVAALTGPVTLAAQLYGEAWLSRIGDVKAHIVAVLEAYCTTRPDAVVFMEGPALGQGKLSLPQRKIYNTLKNITAYYGIPSGLYLEGYPPEGVLQFSALQMEFYILGLSASHTMASLPDLVTLADGAVGFGLGLPFDDVDQAGQLIEQGRKLHAQGGRFFFTSLGPLTRDVDLDTLHTLIGKIKALAS